MKLIGIDLDNSKDKSTYFFSQVEKILDTEIIVLQPYDIESKNPYSYSKFTKAGFSLEEFVFDEKNIDYWTQTKPFINCIYVWGDYNITDVHHLKQFNDIYLKDLIVFSTTEKEYTPQWVFGNIVAMIKWSTSLFRIDDELLKLFDKDRDLDWLFIGDNKLKMPMWYANRINLDVRYIQFKDMKRC